MVAATASATTTTDNWTNNMEDLRLAGSPSFAHVPTMDLRFFVAALLVSVVTIGYVQGQGGGLLDIVQKLLDEKITDPQTKQLVMSKLPDIQVCLMGMASMTPQVAMQVIDQMIPALNTCGMQLSSTPDDQKSSVYVSCSQEAVAKVKSATGMSADDAKIFDDGMGCLQKALGF
ncbi:uncharacterized protein [Dermacentor albipictus]|uniref:uncharacterized protein isoform X3 n=1 Tax=Dermacentor albipictus TaxID=60249 RepID=UPI0031FBB887